MRVRSAGITPALLTRTSSRSTLGAEANTQLAHGDRLGRRRTPRDAPLRLGRRRFVVVRPKSVRYACLPAIRTLCGLTSRCTSPASWAASSAAATCATIATASSGGSGPTALEDRRQVLTVDEAHREVERAALLTRLVDRDDVGVVQRSREPGLTPEARAEVQVLGERRRDHLERDGTLQAVLNRSVHHAHPAAADDTLDLVAAETRPGLKLRHRAELSHKGSRQPKLLPVACRIGTRRQELSQIGFVLRSRTDEVRGRRCVADVVASLAALRPPRRARRPRARSPPSRRRGG